jgi:hypothetical protein
LTDFSKAAIWLTAFFNRHYVVALSSIMVLLALSFQPVSAALFSVREVFMELPGSASITIIPDLAPFILELQPQVLAIYGQYPLIQPNNSKT